MGVKGTCACIHADLPPPRLTVGPPCGRVKELSAKVKAINDKYGPFEALLCLGDLFTPYRGEGAEMSQDESDLLEGELKREGREGNGTKSVGKASSFSPHPFLQSPSRPTLPCLPHRCIPGYRRL